MADHLRVLLDCRMATWTGIGRYATGLARELSHAEGIELIQVIAEDEQPPARAEAVSAAKHPFSMGGARELARIAEKAAPDVVHCTHFPTPVPAPHPLIVTLHDLTPLLVAGVMPSVFKRAAYRWWNIRAAENADVILANSENTAADIVHFFPAAAGKITVVEHTAEGFADGPVGVLPLGLLGEGEPFLLSMGNTKAHKDLPTLLRAFSQIASQQPRLRLLLVGSDEPGYAESVLGDDLAAARVAFTGRVGDETLRALYSKAAVFAFPSLYEGFGLPPLEAMAFGTPVVTSDAASLPEVVGDAALLFPAGDAGALAACLRSLLGDADLRARLSAAGLVRAGELTWARTTAETIAAYRRVIGAS